MFSRLNITGIISSPPVLHIDEKGDICIKGFVKNGHDNICVISYDFAIINFMLKHFKTREDTFAQITGSLFFKTYNNQAGYPEVGINVNLDSIRTSDTTITKKDEVDYILKFNTYHYALNNYNDDKKVKSTAAENVVLNKFKEVHELVFPDVDFSTVKILKTKVEEKNVNEVIKRQRLGITDELKKRLLEKSDPF